MPTCASRCSDWAGMRGRIAEVDPRLPPNPPPLPDDEVAEAVAFLDWLADDNFTLLGMREYRFPDGRRRRRSGRGHRPRPAARPDREGAAARARARRDDARRSAPSCASPVPLIITKANVKSRVHRRVHLDYIGVKLFSPDGRLAANCASSACSPRAPTRTPQRTCPIMRHKVAQVMRPRRASIPSSYAGRALLNVLENYPRDELFQIDEDTLLPLRHRHHEPVRAAARARAGAARRVRPLRLGARLHPEGPLRHARCASASASSWRALYKGRVSAAYPAYPEGPLARTHYIIGRDEGETPQVDRDDAGERHRRHRPHLERRAARGARRDDRRRAGPRARGALRRRLHAPPTARRSRAEQAIADIAHPRAAVGRASRAPSTSIAATATTTTAST